MSLRHTGPPERHACDLANVDSASLCKLDNEVLQIAEKHLETLRLFLDRSSGCVGRWGGAADVTLFPASARSGGDYLLRETKVHFTRAFAGGVGPVYAVV